MSSIPPVRDLFRLFFDQEYCFNYLYDEGFFYTVSLCPLCNRNMTYYSNEKHFRCTKKGCNKKVSVRTNSFFSKSNLQLGQILHIAYYWVSKSSVDTTNVHVGVSRQAVCDYYNYFRELVSSSVSEVQCCIGGEGIIVELDESKIGKRKYNRGHRVEGVWLFGGVERTLERRCFFVPVEDRSTETLLSVARRYILPGSIVYTDMWRAYPRIMQELNLQHFTVNHSVSFVNEETGVHTNTIEGTWNGLKLQIRPRSRCRDGIEERLGEFQWRRENASCLWNSLLAVLKDTHYD